MFDSPEQILNTIVLIAVFGLVLSLWICCVVMWARRVHVKGQQIETRLGTSLPTAGSDRVLQLWHDGREAKTTVPGSARDGGKWVARLNDEVHRAGWKMSGAIFLVLIVGIGVIGAAVVWVLSSNLVLSIAAAVAALVIGRVYLGHRAARHDALFERQFLDALGLAARSLRAGHPLMGAFQLVSEEMAPPVSNIFGDICQKHAMGLEMDEVLQDAAEHTVSNDMKLFATSVAIQMRSGGNLATLMDRLAVVIRERIRLARRARILTAQSQLSKRILLVLPFIVFVLFNVLNPNYMEPLYSTMAGRIMLGAGALQLAIGAWVMNRMAVLKF